jgi:hypothetical protein
METCSHTTFFQNVRRAACTCFSIVHGSSESGLQEALPESCKGNEDAYSIYFGCEEPLETASMSFNGLPEQLVAVTKNTHSRQIGDAHLQVQGWSLPL